MANHAILFGLNIDPVVDRPDETRALAQLADAAGLDFVAVQDHAYNPRFAETWTFLTFLGAMTTRVHLLTNVATLALRPPLMLAKAAATLDRLTGGRVELGIGTGAFPDGIRALGGQPWTPAEAVTALEEALRLIRQAWQAAERGEAVTFEGTIFRAAELHFGPAPAHPIRLWTGANRPRAQRVTGRLADGISVSTPYIPPEQLPSMNRTIDEAAREAGRDPKAIRRLYNMLGVLEGPGERPVRATRPGLVVGPVSYWVDEILRVIALGMDAVTFWPVAGNYVTQARRFVEEVVPAVLARLEGASS